MKRQYNRKDFGLIYLICLVALSSSCTRVVFDVPQPKGVKALKAFPVELRGWYMSEDDVMEDTMLITASSMITPTSSLHEIPLSELDQHGHVRVADNLVYDRDVSATQGYPYTIEDSILRYTVTSMDTMTISDTLVLKEYKGYYVLNFGKPGEWDVYLAKWAEDGVLQSYAVGNFRRHDKEDADNEYDGEIKDFFDIIEFENFDEDDYLIRPSKKQFMQLIERGLFVKQGVMKKMD